MRKMEEDYIQETCHCTMWVMKVAPLYLSHLLYLLTASCCRVSSNGRHYLEGILNKLYVVYLGLNHIGDPMLTSLAHVKLLANVFESDLDAKQSVLYSYTRSFAGFAANLNSTQAATIASTEEVISVFKSKTRKLHTTRSWDFMGLTLDNNRATPVQLSNGENVVVGVFDTGIWPQTESFKEEPGMGPVPRYWKGECVKGEKFEPARDCNRKLIGACYYLKGFESTYGPIQKREFRSARDYVGHGTHTASTAVGSIVKNASFFGFAQGTARGAAPRARLAVYKVCWNVNLDALCTDADIIAAFDDALDDGVHVISASFGTSPPLLPFFQSNTDIGSFHAMQAGVSMVFSAGNDGPIPSLVQNVAPWSLCVAALSIDRSFPTYIILDNDISIMGDSLILKEVTGRLDGAITYFQDGICSKEAWNKKPATNMIVLCFSTIGPIPAVEVAEEAVKKANGSGLIFVQTLGRQDADVDIIPTVRVNFNQGAKIDHYLGQSQNLPVVRIMPSKTVIKETPAPAVAYFSSRGPSSISPDILKPDVTAPGLNILAAWPPNTPPSIYPNDGRKVNWNFLSGTSQSCPHVSGVVALIKAAHPDWSSAAIRSALMTTAYTRDTTLDTILAGGSLQAADPFDIGAGHINPIKAMDPGLIYDMKASDYTLFLCNIGYSEGHMQSMTGTKVCCPGELQSNANMNYPSITVPNLDRTMTIKRTVRNVDYRKNAVYFPRVVNPEGVQVFIWPKVLIFSWFKEEISFYMTLKPTKESAGRYDFGEIVWSDGFHQVRSPVVVFVNNTRDSTASAVHSTV